MRSTRRHKFELPQALVEQEFENLWQTVTAENEGRGQDLRRREHDRGRGERRIPQIADRRVRLGLVLAEIGDKNNIKVTDEEVTRAVVEHARQIPGREKQVWDYYRKNPEALAELRAPMFEERSSISSSRLPR